MKTIKLKGTTGVWYSELDKIQQLTPLQTHYASFQKLECTWVLKGTWCAPASVSWYQEGFILQSKSKNRHLSFLSVLNTSHHSCLHEYLLYYGSRPTSWEYGPFVHIHRDIGNSAFLKHRMLLCIKILAVGQTALSCLCKTRPGLRDQGHIVSLKILHVK